MTMTASKSHRKAEPLDLPAWVKELDPDHFRLVRTCVKGATKLSPADFERATAEAYGEIARQIDAAPRRYPVRFWNYIPAIHHPCGAGVDRYMIFNAGRFAACRQWLHDPCGFERHLPTASAVGHDGEDLFINALACDRRGAAIENPLQTPAYRYSPRYGPRPPCFARATKVGELLLVGGTASIVGEDSAGAGDLDAQLRQTLTNLRSLVGAGLGNDEDPLLRFTELRVYFVLPADKKKIRGEIDAAFGRLKRLEILRADLCRRELLVEIEGIAR